MPSSRRLDLIGATAISFAATFCSGTAFAAKKSKRNPAAEAPKAAAAATPAAPAAAAKPAAAPAPKEAPTPGPAVDFQSGDVWDVDIFGRDDHKVLVIQDRKYTKAKKLELGLDLGQSFSSPFYTTYSYGFHLDYHLTEYLGLETFYTHSSSSSSADKTQLDDFLISHSFASRKEYHEPTSFYGAAFLWSPIYGKFAFFRKSIIHFDIYGSAGLGMISLKSNLTDKGGKNQNNLGPTFSAGMRVFLSRYWSLRLDARNLIYRAYFAPVDTGGTGSTLTRASWQFTMGVNFLLGGGN